MKEHTSETYFHIELSLTHTLLNSVKFKNRPYGLYMPIMHTIASYIENNHQKQLLHRRNSFLIYQMNNRLNEKLLDLKPQTAEAITRGHLNYATKKGFP